VSHQDVLVDVNGGIGVTRLNRPDSLNALNSVLLQELGIALEGLENHTAVKVVVLMSTSPKAFVAGADIQELLDLDPRSGQEFAERGQRLVLQMERMKKPVIAAVSGYALGGGLELALACDFIYASDRAQFGMPEVTLGTIPGFGGTQTLSRLIGPNRARELIFSGKMLSAGEALDWGIVNRVFPEQVVMDEVMKIAGSIAQNGDTAVAYAKEAILSGLTRNDEDGFRYESTLFSRLCATEDRRMRMQAFLDKRKPGVKARPGQ